MISSLQEAVSRANGVANPEPAASAVIDKGGALLRQDQPGYVVTYPAHAEGVMRAETVSRAFGTVIILVTEGVPRECVYCEESESNRVQPGEYWIRF